LKNHAGVRTQEFDYKAVIDQTAVIQGVQNRVVPECGPALVHHLGLPLGIEVLGNFAYDPDDFTLPGLQQRSIFFDEVEQVFLGFIGETLDVSGLFAFLQRQGAPQVIDLGLQIFFPFDLAVTLLLCR